MKILICSECSCDDIKINGKKESPCCYHCKQKETCPLKCEVFEVSLGRPDDCGFKREVEVPNNFIGENINKNTLNKEVI